MRILVTGSRDWKDIERLQSALLAEIVNHTLEYDEPVIVVHGDCPTGADAMAHRFAKVVPICTPEPHPADWQKHGRSAGPIRNRHMVGLGADVCLAFIRGGSAGATGCANMAEVAGIPTKRYLA